MNQAEPLIIMNNKLDGILSIGIQLFFLTVGLITPM